MGGGGAQHPWKVSRSQPARLPVLTSLHPGHSQAEPPGAPTASLAAPKVAQHPPTASAQGFALCCRHWDEPGKGKGRNKSGRAWRAGEGLGGQRCAAGACEHDGKGWGGGGSGRGCLDAAQAWPWWVRVTVSGFGGGLHLCGQKMGGWPTQGLCTEGLQCFAGANSGAGAGRFPQSLSVGWVVEVLISSAVEAHGLRISCTVRWRQHVGLGSSLG